jgi:hypothetical protein
MGMIDLFKDQLENESAALAASRGLQKRGDFLMWWYFSKLTGLASEDIEEVICDGFMDLGIDAIYIDDSNIVHFYNFKNPETLGVTFPSVEVDKLIGGLSLIVGQQEGSHANEALKARLEEIRQIVPSAYKIHLVTSGTGIQADCGTKLDLFITGLRAPSPDFCTWKLEDIEVLHTAFYTQSLPTVDDAYEIALAQAPYPVRSADNDCYMFHMSGAELAALYEKHGEKLLQQNIRVSQGDRTTNALILKTASSDDAGRFFNYNNGIVFLAETAQFDGFTKKLTLRRFQIVNGGQTIRMIYRAQTGGQLRSEVLVPVRVITSQGDKEFANNVTVNLNNQNRIQPSFLRSNDPRVVQLAAVLASKGWYFERRENEVKTMVASERAAIEARIGAPLAERTIRLKEGMQAYAATFLRQPELAKKNPKRIFLSAEDGGMFDRVFDDQLTAERVILANRMASLVGDYVRQFMARKRRKGRVQDWRVDYSSLLGSSLVDKYGSQLDQVLPQSAMFLTAIVFDEWIAIHGRPIDELLAKLEGGDYSILNEMIELILDDKARQAEGGARSWPTLLKSQPYFEGIAKYLRGRASR